MIKFKILKTAAFFVCFFWSSLMPGQSTIKIDSLNKSEISITNHILYLDLIGTLFYEELGLIYSNRSDQIDYQLYVNYIYGGGLMNDTPFESASVRKWTNQRKSPENGFEIGAQLRIPYLRNWEKQPYADFIKDKTRSYYYGVWGELAFKKGDVRYDWQYESFKTTNATIGVITGWTEVKRNFASDFFVGIGIGRASAELKILDETTIENKNGFLFVFKTGLRVGINL